MTTQHSQKIPHYLSTAEKVDQFGKLCHQCGHERCDRPDLVMQNMLTGSMDSMRVGWRRSLQSHVLCGRLAGLARHGADVESCSTALCTKVRTTNVTKTINLRNTSMPRVYLVLDCHPRGHLHAAGMCLQVLSTGQAAKLAHMTDMHPGACAALCMEVRCQKAGPKLSGTLPAAPKVPRDPKAGVPQARTLIMTDISTSEVQASPVRVCALHGVDRSLHTPGISNHTPLQTLECLLGLSGSGSLPARRPAERSGIAYSSPTSDQNCCPHEPLLYSQHCASLPGLCYTGNMQRAI